MKSIFRSLASISLAIATFTLMSCSGSIPSSKKEIMDRFVAGKLPAKYAPAAFFVHFANDQKVGEAAVQAHLDYFHEINPDILKVQFEQFAPRIRELEVRDDWMPEDYYRPTVEIIKRLQEEAGADTYVLPTVYSTFQVTTQSLGHTKMNILHICDWEGTYDDLAKFADYPGQIVNTPMTVDGKPFSLADGVKLFGRPVLGGFNRQTEILSAPAETIAEMTRKILDEGPAGKIMIGADCTVSSAPHENLQAAVSTAHGTK